MATISLASGYVTKPALPHILLNAFKNLASVAFDSEYTFKQAEALKEAAKNTVHVAATTSAAPVKEEPKVEEKKPEPEADVDMGGLFGEEY